MDQRLVRVALASVCLTVWPQPALAHEKWFTDTRLFPTQWLQAMSAPQVIGVVAAVVATLVLALVWRATGRRPVLPGPTALGATPDGLTRFYALVPLILGIHV